MFYDLKNSNKMYNMHGACPEKHNDARPRKDQIWYYIINAIKNHIIRHIILLVEHVSYSGVYVSCDTNICSI